MEIPYVYNNNWICTRGNEFFNNGIITFPEYYDNKPDRTYRSHFGPCFPHKGRILANTNQTTSDAFRYRLAAKRFPLDEGKHERLFVQQGEFFEHHSPIFTQLSNNYTPYFQEYTNAFEEALKHHADAHPKRQLRIDGFNELVEERADSLPGWVRTAVFKLKTDEIAKPGGKPGRGIINLGIIASLLGFVITKMLKNAMAKETFIYKGIIFEFVQAPIQSDLDRVLCNLIDPPGRGYFVFFSDDSCYAVRDGPTVRRYNVDISKCDASHGPAIFSALSKITPDIARSDMKNLINQCGIPIKIFNKTDRTQYVKLKPRNKVLYSGCTITTVLNNLANIAIGLSLANEGAASPEQIKEASELAGYAVTVEDCTDDWHKLQFLKNSPCRDTTGKIRAVLNVGVLNRASGVCRGDLPGRGDLKVRAQQFQASLIQGAYPRLSTPYVDALRVPHTTNAKLRADMDELIKKKFQYKVDNDSPVSECFTVSSEEYFARYDLTPLEIAELVDMAAQLGYQQHYSSPATNKIYLLDYGLEAADDESDPYGPPPWLDPSLTVRNHGGAVKSRVNVQQN